MTYVFNRIFPFVLIAMLSVTPVWADLTGAWKDMNGSQIDITQKGNQLTLVFHRPGGNLTVSGSVDASYKKLTYQEGGLTYEGQIVGEAMVDLRTSNRFVGQWKKPRTPVEGPGAVRLDPTGNWTEGQGKARLMVQAKGESIRLLFGDVYGNQVAGKAHWVSTNSFEFTVDGQAGKNLCKIEWWQRGMWPGRHPYQMTSEGSMGHLEFNPFDGQW